MSHPYQVLGTSVPAMLGRARIVEELERHLFKPTPDHVQIVAPTLFGKSVLLCHLASKHRGGSAGYITTAYADLRHAPPLNDGAFRQRFAEVTKAALEPVKPAIAEYIDPTDGSVHELLDLAFQELEQEGARILVVLDGFDHVLAGPGLTRTLWDQLRSLGQKKSLRLVTGSRRPLRDLCRTEESRTSDFWEIFYPTPIQVGPFGDGDWDDVLAPLTPLGLSIDSSGRKELANWSGGVPVLAAVMLERLVDGARGGVLSKAEVDRVADSLLAHPPAPLAQLWDDCGFELRGDIATMAAESEGIPLSELSESRRRALERRGYGLASGNRMRSSCRLMAKYALLQAPAVADLKRLFGTRAQFESNVRALLELRLSQAAEAGIDAQLRNYVMHAIRDIDSEPEAVLIPVRSLVQRALRLIWDAEVGASREFPEDWVNEWKHGGAKPRWLEDSRRVPAGDGQQMYALQLMTGTKLGDKFIRRKAKFATKPMCLLLDALQSMGDYGQHRNDFPESAVSKSFAVTVVMTAIEVAEYLARDLATTRRPRDQAGE